MHSTQEKFSEGFGNSLVDDVSLSQQSMNLLFSALLLTAIGVFVAANLLLLYPETLYRSAQMTVACVGLLLVFYAVSYQTRSVTWGLLLTYGLLWFLVYSRLIFLSPVFYMLFLAAGFFAWGHLRVEKKQWLEVVMMAVIAVAAIMTWAMLYTSFDMLPRLHAGNVHQDTLFHASIAAMIKNYGVSSTGLHGLVEVPYHVFSHVLMAAISLISGFAVVEVYGVANSVFLAPILFLCAVAFVGKIDQTRRISLSVAWIILALLLVVLPSVLKPWAVFPSFFVSESYLVSLGLLFLGLVYLFKRCLTWLDLVAVFFLAIMIANAKASVGMIFSGLWFARFIFLAGEKRTLSFVGGVLTAFATAWVVLDSAQATSGNMPVSPLHFIRAYSLLGSKVSQVIGDFGVGVVPALYKLALAFFAIVSFFVFHFLISWLVVGRVYFLGGLRAVFSSPIAVYSSAAVFAGSLIVLIFSIPGGSAGYFSNVAFFVSLPGLIAFLADFYFRKNRKFVYLSLFSVLLICLLGFKNFYATSRFSSFRDITAPSNNLVDALQQMRDVSALNIVYRLDSIESLGVNPVSRCTAQPFVYPAVSERPWIGVVPDGALTDCRYRNYGYEQYGIIASNWQVTVSPRLLDGMVIQSAP